jgi:DNA modification methylase
VAVSKLIATQFFMPELTWPSKALPAPPPAALHLDSLVYPAGGGYPNAAPAGQLIWGENLAVMAALLPAYAGQINLIYADPPFFTNRRYPARIGRGEDSRRPQEWKLAEGYPDHWPDLDAYLDMLYPRLVLMHRLLAPTGTLYLHLDWHASAYARLLLDELFGADNLLNEIAWVYHGPSPIRSAFNRKHDTILVYTKSREYTFNADAVRQPYHPVTVRTFASSPRAGFGKVPDLARGKVPEDWWYFPVVARLHNERTGYPTQKPEALLERIILASSNPGELVADFFCGSGTAAAVTMRLGRRFIASDAAWRAVHTARARLAGQAGAQPWALHRLVGQPEPPVDLAPPAFCLAPDRLSVLVETPDLSDLDYWEVDPAWDGQAFRSAVQAVRPRQRQVVVDQLTLPNPPAGQKVVVRWVRANGASGLTLVT